MMAGISPNIITVEPSIDGIVAGLREAAAGVGHVHRRVAGSEVRWSRDWDQSFNDEVLTRVIELLEA